MIIKKGQRFREAEGPAVTGLWRGRAEVQKFKRSRVRKMVGV